MFFDINELLVRYSGKDFSFCSVYFQERSSRGGLEVELWTDNSLPSASVDQIPLGAMYVTTLPII